MLRVLSQYGSNSASVAPPVCVQARIERRRADQPSAGSDCSSMYKCLLAVANVAPDVVGYEFSFN